MILQISDKDLVEVLLQGYYCLQYCKMKKILVCLTDLAVWHYMLLESSGNKIKITGHKFILGMNEYKTFTSDVA